jgi:hypothetical protein
VPPEQADKTIQELYAGLVDDRARNELIVGDLLRAVQDGCSPLLLTARTEHLRYFETALEGDPLKLLEKYFDAFVYVANWGTREFHLRLPQALADLKNLKSILPGKAVRVRSAGKFVIIAFESEVESDDDWDDGTGWMGSLVSLRSDLLRGDLRCLYLGWLMCAQDEEFSEDAMEPPVPAGLRELSAPLIR